MTAEGVYRRAMDRMAGGQARNSAIQIRRSPRKKGGGVSPVHAAWQAFREGRYREADERYAAVLVKEPFNRDALLGRAAVAVAMGKPRLAQDFYLRLLERDPRDPLAQAGMVALQGRRQPVEAIARVRQLIAVNPDLGGLNFILGNLYAAQERWAYAQQAYFKAHVSDPGNPDYLFNLAVSLDHLGKERQALEFYRRALQQAGQRKARFQAEVVSRRIQALAAVENSP
jgi:tetratricopeptide (TPR) repeat protein